MLTPSLALNNEASQNLVLRNTYGLLSLTLVWSAIAAALGVIVQVGGLGMLGVFVASIALLFATLAFRNSGWGLLMIFGFTGLMGFSLGPTLTHFLSLPHGAQTIGTALFATGAAFIGLSAYVHISKRDFSFLGGFLLVGLIGVLVVSLIGMFFHVPGLSLVMSYITVLIFSGYILYDTSDIVSGRQTNYIAATVGLYLDILNVFVSMLNILSDD